MIPFDELVSALERAARRSAGEHVPEPTPQQQSGKVRGPAQRQVREPSAEINLDEVEAD